MFDSLQPFYSSAGWRLFMDLGWIVIFFRLFREWILGREVLDACPPKLIKILRSYHSALFDERSEVLNRELKVLEIAFGKDAVSYATDAIKHGHVYMTLEGGRAVFALYNNNDDTPDHIIRL